MPRLLSIILSVLAAGSGVLPPGRCLLEMAGDCCGQTHIDSTDCGDHDHDVIADGDFGAQVSRDSQHRCITLVGDGIAARAQHVPVIDSRQDHPLPCVAVPLACEELIAGRTIFDRRTFLNPLDSPLFLIGRSFLI